MIFEYAAQAFSNVKFFQHPTIKPLALLLAGYSIMRCVMPLAIILARQWLRASARAYTPKEGRLTERVPTMGGIFILIVATVITLLVVDVREPAIFILLGSTWLSGIIGLIDDVSKIRSRGGISASAKWWLQLVMAVGTIGAWWHFYAPAYTLPLPVWLGGPWHIGIAALALWTFIIMATTNAVNLTDGLDGLALSTWIVCMYTLNVIATLYTTSPLATPLMLLASLWCGVALGFLRDNWYPAKIIMGDVGALALGTLLAVNALLLRVELLIPLLGIVFFLETASVIIQVAWFKRTGSRIFRMAPLHHHFELIGWHETTIVALACLTTTCAGLITWIICTLTS